MGYSMESFYFYYLLFKKHNFLLLQSSIPPHCCQHHPRLCLLLLTFLFLRDILADQPVIHTVYPTNNAEQLLQRGNERPGLSV